MFNSEFVRKIKADVFEALLPMAREPIEKTDFDEVLMYLENVVKTCVIIQR